MTIILSMMISFKILYSRKVMQITINYNRIREIKFSRLDIDFKENYQINHLIEKEK